MILNVNGNMETILTDEDFAFLIEKYMGNEAKQYYYSIVNSYDEELYDLNCELSELKDNC